MKAWMRSDPPKSQRLGQHGVICNRYRMATEDDGARERCLTKEK